MGCVQQAVLEFDEEVQAPWRPRLVAVAGRAAPVARRRPRARRARPAAARSRVGICRPRGAGGRAGRRPSAARACRRRRRRRSRPPWRPSGAPALARAAPADPAGPPARRRPGAGARGRARLLARRRCSAGGGRRPAPGRACSSVVVQPGDTLWSIASRWPATATCARSSTEIRELNGLAGHRLVPGQVLELP